MLPDYLIGIMLGLGVAAYGLPRLIVFLREHGMVVPDKYKPSEPDIPTSGGLIFFGIAIAVVAVIPFRGCLLGTGGADDCVSSPSQDQLAPFALLLAYGFFGWIDDLFPIPDRFKILVPVFLAWPFTASVPLDSIREDAFFGGVTAVVSILLGPLGVGVDGILRFIVLPVFVMVVANLLNMHSGFNGLQSGQCTILFSAALILTLGAAQEIAMLLAATWAGLLVFFVYNSYPASVFEGNMGVWALGAVLSAGLLARGLGFLILVLFLPHIVNFALYLAYKVTLAVRPGQVPSAVKFASLDSEGHIVAPGPWTLKYLPLMRWKMHERKATFVQLAITACAAGIAVLADLWPAS